MHSLWNNRRILKFILVGGSAAILNLVLMFLLVDKLGFNNTLLRNIANILAVFISTIYAFTFHRSVTWGDLRENMVHNIQKQFSIFVTNGIIAILLRFLLFYVFDLLGMYYLINVSLGIALVGCVNYFINHNLTFKAVR
jgi:dolichol-phosphate mannosyltransferase